MRSRSTAWIAGFAMLAAAVVQGAAGCGSEDAVDVADAAPPGSPLPVVVPPGIGGMLEAGAARRGRGAVLTSRNDNERTGANLGEEILSADNVRGLGRLGSFAVDGELFAQPLVAEAISTPGGTKNLLLAATMNNSVFAFDVDAVGSAPLWHRGEDVLGPATSLHRTFARHGILATPVIDHDLVYVVSRSCDPAKPASAPACTYRLFAFALGTGELVRSVVIAAGMDGGALAFDPNSHWNRPGLLLHHGRIYVAFGAGPKLAEHEEDVAYHGWLLGYDANDFDVPPTVYCSTPRGRGGGIWQSGSGVAADDASIYFVTGNSLLSDEVHVPADYPLEPRDDEDSVVKLGAGAPQKYWDTRTYVDAGNVFQHLEANDVDFGSAAPLLVPGSSALVSGSKAGIVYVLDRGTMTATQTPLSPFNQPPLQPGHTLYIHSWWGNPVIYGSLAYWRPDAPGNVGIVYGWAGDDLLKSFRFDHRSGQLTVDRTASVGPVTRGSPISVSAHGGETGSGVVWAATLSPVSSGGKLWAFDAMTLETLASIEVPSPAKWTPLTIAQGKVFLPTAANSIVVYGVPR